METKVKKFSKKLLALFLAVLMAVSCFTGVISVYGASSDPEYGDLDITANFMNWVELTDEQTAGALLDWLDSVLAGVNLNLNINAVVVSINGTVDSVDGLLDLIDQLDATVDSNKTLLGGDAKNIKLCSIHKNLDNPSTDPSSTTSACGKGYRAVYDAKTILKAIAQILYDNTHNNGDEEKNVVGSFLRGTFTFSGLLSTILDLAIGSGDIYELLQGALNLEDGYETDFAYNLLQTVILDAFYKVRSSEAYQQAKALPLDDMMFNLLSKELLQKISVLVTYGQDYTDAEGNSVQDNSKVRRANIERYMEENNKTYAEAAVALGYDPNLIYSSESEFEDNILLFAYGSPDSNGHATEGTQKLTIAAQDNLLEFGMRALKIAWQTVLKDSIGLLHANYSTDRGHGTNFDNLYYYWAISANSGIDKWDEKDLASMYSADNLNNWATHEVVGDLVYNEETDQWEDKLHNTYDVTTDKTGIRNDKEVKIYDENGRVIQQATMPMYTDYGAKDATEFLGWVKETFEYDREAIGDGNWRDIDPTQLFGKLRYSPMADYGFNMTTGPINLYFMQTGSSNIDAYFDGLVANSGNTTLISGLNNALIAAVQDIFVNSNNVNNIENYPALAPESSSDPAAIASTLVSNAAKVFQYAADSADANILKAFYDNDGQEISEANLEEAALPLLIACLREINMLDPVRDSDWDKCANVEGIAYIALREYLSYILPERDYDDLVPVVNGKYSIEFTSEDNSNPILLMARDALAYILQGSVPIIDENGNKVFDVYNIDQYDDVTIWDIFNAIAGYYVCDSGVADLLGLYDESGNVAFKRTNTIWQNIDVVVNKFFPVIGELQYGTPGQASSYDLIWNDIVNGALNISTEQDGRCGIENFIYRLLTIASAEPITADPVIYTVYSFLEKLLNGLFGARTPYGSDQYTTIVPTVEQLGNPSAPFDTVLHQNVLTYWCNYNGNIITSGDSGCGLLGSLIYNLYGFMGGGNKLTGDRVDGFWSGLCFVLKAVNNFVPSFIPQIGSHTLGTLQASVDNSSVNLTSGSAYSSNVRLTNTSNGLNRFYTDKDGKQQEQGRYYMEITNVTTDNSGFTISGFSSGDMIEPQETVLYGVSGTATSENLTVAVNVTYNIYQSSVDRDAQSINEKATLLAEGLVTTTYFYITPDPDWFNTTYPRGPGGENDQTNRFPEGMEPDAGGSNDYVKSTAAGGTKNNLYFSYPRDLVITSSQMDRLDKIGVRVRNRSNRFTGSDTAFDGVYVYPSESQNVQAYAVNGTTISETTSQISGESYAYCAINPENGDIYNHNRLDFSSDGGKTWDRGPLQRIYSSDGDDTGVDIHVGYTQTEIEDKVTRGEIAGDYITRSHVAFTFSEACEQGIINAVQRTKTADGYTYQAVFLNTKKDNNLTTRLIEGLTAENTDEAKYSISLSTPTNGIYLTLPKYKQAKNSSSYLKWLSYDGTTEIKNDSYEMSIFFFTVNNQNMKGTINVHTVDTSTATSLDSIYNQYNKWLASYQQSDFVDESGTQNPEAFINLQNALKEALAARSASVNVSNASDFASKTERRAIQAETASILGDEAYLPVPADKYSQLPSAIAAYVYSDGSYLYWNEECTEPLYSRDTNLVASDRLITDYVKNPTSEVINGTTYQTGTDPTGKVQVIEDPKTGVWHVRNEVLYEYEWDLETYPDAPYYGATDVQAKNAQGELLYLQDQFAYRTAEGVKTVSNSTTAPWVFKIAELETAIIPNEPGVENRGIYQCASDRVTYYGQIAEGLVSTQTLPTARLATEIRNGMNNANYEIMTYEQMVGVARELEGMYSYDAYKNHYLASDVTYNEDGDPVPNEGAQPIFSCLDSDWDEYWNNYLDAGGYSGVEIVSIEDRSKTVYNTSSSATAVQNAINNFVLFYQGIQPREYAETNTGNQIAKEIALSIGDAYDKFIVTQPATYGVDENGNTVVKTPAVISVTDGATLIRGAVDESGNLVNEGETVYTDDSWNMYTARLADAIASRQAETDTISNTYTLKSNLLIAEKALEEDVPTGYNVTASLVIATDNKGTTSGTGVTGQYTITLYEQGTKNMVGTPYVFDLTADAKSFTLEAVPAGTYDMVISASEFVMPRTVTLKVGSSDIVEGPEIPMVVCNYDGDNVVTANDALSVYAQASAGSDDARYNLDGDSVVTANDALIVYACASGTIDMPEITIE